jgi:signal peptidase I
MKFACFLYMICASALVVRAEVPAVSIVSASSSRETRRSSAIAPNSTISVEQANDVAEQAQRLVPGTMVYSVRPTGSMRPLFDGNCLLLTEKAKFESLEVGDIVVFRHSRTGTLVVHRILERQKNGFWTKGDHNDGMDSDLVTPKNYQARIYGIIYTSRSRDNIADSARHSLAMASASVN